MSSYSAINNTMAVLPRSLNWQLCQKLDQAIWNCPEITIEIRWSKNRFSAEPLVVNLQGVRMGSLQKAFQFLKVICCYSRLITKLDVNVQVSDTRAVNALLHIIDEAKNIRLEEIRFRRRYVGQHFSALVNLIKQHATTLKIVGKIGLGEAVQAFDKYVHLERLSLMNFDLINNGKMESAELADNTRACLRRLSGLGATFDHLSFTAYSGIQITRLPTLYFLKICNVSSLRLTMQTGVAIPAPNLSRALLPNLSRLELIGQVEIDPNSNLEVLFPNLKHFNFECVDLATNQSQASVIEVDETVLASRERYISEADANIAVDYDNDMQQETRGLNADVSAMAAAC